MAMDKNVAALMMFKYQETIGDKFGRAHGPRSLLLDNVMNGRPRVSRCRLLQLPAEILANVVDLLADDKPALASLALVNSDCRQLARCRQFAEICFDYGHETRQLVKKIASEATDPNHPLSISACVRRVVLESTPKYVKGFHTELFAVTFGGALYMYTEEERLVLRKKAADQYAQIQIESATAICLGLPNLEVLVWEDEFAVDRDFFTKLSSCPAKHVRLNGVYIEGFWPLGPPLTATTWPLRSLHLHVMWKPPEYSPKDKPTNPRSPFFSTLFQLCAPTLEKLNWIHKDLMLESPISLGSNPVSFPRLRHLQLYLIRLDAPSFSTFLSSPLRDLELSAGILEQHIDSLLACGTRRQLESFVLANLPFALLPCMNLVKFLSQNNHIKKLYVHERKEAYHGLAYIDDCIIPMLATGNFSNLRSLSLSWGGGRLEGPVKSDTIHIEETSLAVIGTIVPLEQLSLSSGIANVERRPWLVNHSKLREHFRNLSSLKRLALSLDTYPIPVLDIDAENYYAVQFITDEERAAADPRIPTTYMEENNQLDSKLRTEEEDTGPLDNKAIWERAHGNRMLAEAEEYAAVLPALEWVLFGQRPIGLERDPLSANDGRHAVLLTTERDECHTFLQKTFGITSPDDA